MASQNQPPKVLRIGIIMDSKIVQERLIKPGETVTVGESPKNTFVLPKTSLPRQDFPLFVPKGSKYVLNFTEAMKGKIGSGGAVVGLEKLRTDPSVEKSNEGWRLPLTEQDRGKIAIDNITVLFQFVSAPPQQAVKPAPMDFRPRLMNEDDTALFGFLALFSALGMIFLVYVWNTPVQEITSIDQVDERWQKLVIKVPEETPQPADQGQQQVAKVEEKKPEKTEEKPDDGASKASPADNAARQEQLKNNLMKQSLLLGLLTTHGDSNSGTAADLWSESDNGDAAAAIRNAGSAEAATAATAGLKTGTGTGDRGDVKIDGGGTIGGGGNSSVKDAPAVKVASVESEDGNSDLEEGDAGAVKGTVKKYQGQLKYCYEERLKANPDLSGRVEIEWNVAGGRVTAANVFANTTGDQDLAECIVSKIKHWSFPPDMNGEVQWPFIFKQKN